MMRLEENLLSIYPIQNRVMVEPTLVGQPQDKEAFIVMHHIFHRIQLMLKLYSKILLLTTLWNKVPLAPHGNRVLVTLMREKQQDSFTERIRPMRFAF